MTFKEREKTELSFESQLSQLKTESGYTWGDATFREIDTGIEITSDGFKAKFRLLENSPILEVVKLTDEAIGRVDRDQKNIWLAKQLQKAVALIALYEQRKTNVPYDFDLTGSADYIVEALCFQDIPVPDHSDLFFMSHTEVTAHAGFFSPHTQHLIVNTANVYQQTKTNKK